jgi:hypothetical protein
MMKPPRIMDHMFKLIRTIHPKTSSEERKTGTSERITFIIIADIQNRSCPYLEGFCQRGFTASALAPCGPL